LKGQNKNVKVSLVEPQGSGLVPIKNPEKDVLDWRMKTDEEKKLSSSSILEGIGSSRMYGNFMKAQVDDVIHVNDAVSNIQIR
jgi:cysteine synthase